MDGSGSSQARHKKTSDKAVDIVVTPEIAEVIARARGLKIKYGLISQFVFPMQKGGAYTRSSLGSMWDRAKERIGMKDDVVFRDIQALAATDAARRGENRSDIQKRLVHTSGKTTDIYIKEVIADVSEIPMALPLLSDDQGPLLSDD
jgi:integrase